uniref:Uncharacterized protein n=1 Tax=Anguilla anguilla TaxID=7936 RepID=A0A0E9VPA0_ANGAN
MVFFARSHESYECAYCKPATPCRPPLELGHQTQALEGCSVCWVFWCFRS